jgi:predicted DNA-binding WGR domain protein
MDGIERFKGPGGRYYQLWVQRDLFGSLVIMRAWGGQRSGRGGFMAKSLASDMECQMELKRIRARRRQRGYVAV